MNVGPVNEVVAARAAKRARSGGWGGGVWVGPARSKKKAAHAGYASTTDRVSGK